MLVSAVLDPSAFNAAHFNPDNPDQSRLYKIQAEDFLKGIEKNGLLIVDPENRLRDALIEKIKSIPIKYGQRLQILVEKLLLAESKSKRVIACSVSETDIKTMNLLDLAYRLKTNTKVDALIVGDDTFLSAPEDWAADLIVLSEYRESDFEEVREKYETHNIPIDKLPECEVKDFIIRSVRFSKELRFYDSFIGRGNNTSNFRKGIEYILSLWNEHGFFPHRTRSVKIYTCSECRGPWNSWKWESLIQKQKERIIRELIRPLKSSFPSWSIEFWIKTDPSRIFHSRHLETEQAIIGVDPGFDFFTRDGKFRRTIFKPNMANASHLKECRDLSDVSV